MYEMTRATPTAILEATLRLIAKAGVDAVRYRDVAEASGVPLGTVSYHFSARPELIRAAFAFFLEQNTATVHALHARLRAPALAEIAEFLTALVRADFADRRRRYLAEYELIVYAARDPAIAEALAGWDRARLAELAPLLERLGVPRPNAAARTLVDIVRGFQLTNLGRRQPDCDDLRRRLHDVLRAFAPDQKKGTPDVRRPKAR